MIPQDIIGVWSQPIFLMDRWKGDGVNTLVGHEPESGKVDKRQWEVEASKRGLYFITVPGDDLAYEAKQPFRIGWMQDDEPDNNRWRYKEAATSPNNSRLILPGSGAKGWTKPELLKARYLACKAAAPDMPVFCNFNGMSLTNLYYTDGKYHKEYIRYSDWIGSDWHIYRDRSRYAVYRQRLQARANDRLTQFSELTDGKVRPLLQYIQASNAQTAGGYPNADEVYQQAALAAACGCKGIIYFAHQLGGSWGNGTAWDGRDPSLVQATRNINASWPFQPASGVVNRKADAIIQLKVDGYKPTTVTAKFDLEKA